MAQWVEPHKSVTSNPTVAYKFSLMLVESKLKSFYFLYLLGWCFKKVSNFPVYVALNVSFIFFSGCYESVNTEHVNVSIKKKFVRLLFGKLSFLVVSL